MTLLKDLRLAMANSIASNKSMSVDRVEQQEMVRTIVALKAQLHLAAGQDCHPSQVPKPIDSTTDWSEAPITPIQIMARRPKKKYWLLDGEEARHRAMKQISHRQ